MQWEESKKAEDGGAWWGGCGSGFVFRAGLTEQIPTAREQPPGHTHHRVVVEGPYP